MPVALIVVLAVCVVVFGGLWLNGRLWRYSSGRAARRHENAELEMKLRPQPPPTHRKRHVDE